MKTYIPYSLILAAAASGMAFGAETAYTTPVGYVAIGDTTVGQPAIKANTDVSVSIPLLRSADFAGVVASSTSTTITITSAAFTINQWAGAAPYVAVIESGTKSGLIVPILSNDATTLTVSPGTFSLTGIAATDKVSIRKAWTVASFMSGASDQNGLIVYAFSGAATGVNVSSDTQYFYNGSGWENGDGDPADNAILYPGDGLIIRSAASPLATFTVTGEVPKANHYIQVGTRAGGPRDTFVSYLSPTSEPLGTSGAGFGAGDILYAFNNAAAGKNKSGVPYFYTGAGWEDGDGEPAGTFPLVGGQAYLYRRASAVATGQQDWQDTQTYIPSL